MGVLGSTTSFTKGPLGVVLLLAFIVEAVVVDVAVVVGASVVGLGVVIGTLSVTTTFSVTRIGFLMELVSLWLLLFLSKFLFTLIIVFTEGLLLLASEAEFGPPLLLPILWCSLGRWDIHEGFQGVRLFGFWLFEVGALVLRQA